MKRRKNWIFLLIILSLITYHGTGCDFAPALIQSSEESTQVETTFEATSEELSENNRKEQTTSEQNQVIYVHVCGQVRKPGLYELPAGSRADAAVKAAGGMKEEADEKQVNLAQVLQDGVQLYVPSEEESAQGYTSVVENQSTSGDSTVAANQTGLAINLNTASADDLKKLPGIGESKANAIIEYRETNGLFSSIEDVKKVSGIGDGIYEKIKNDITV